MSGSLVVTYWFLAGIGAVIGAGAGGIVVMWAYRRLGLMAGGRLK
jgi:hypothetical protein